LRQTFDAWDVDKSGHIDERELASALGQLGELNDIITVREMIKSYDRDGSGTIDFNGNRS
jgi:Ca2+-binding EF-hand superfamily protein